MGKKDEKVAVVEKEEVVETVEEEVLDEKDSKIKELEEKVTLLTAEIEKVKKAAADIVNRSKQMEIDKKYAASDLIKKLLVPLSYFEGALKFKSEDEAINNFLKGFEMIYHLIFNTLESEGLKEIKTNINDVFDPRIHEVTELIEVEDSKDLVLEIVQKGYLYKERVIKPVQVKVSTYKKEISEEIENNEDNENNQDIVN